MTAFAGRQTVVNASVDGTTWHAIGELNSVEIAIGGNPIDVTQFGVSDVQRILGLRDTPWTLSGFYDPTDTNGQNVILSALLNNTALYLQVMFNPSGTSGQKGFHQQVIPTKFDVKGDPASAQTVSISADSTGAITQD